MLLKVYRRGSTRCLALLGALLTALVCLYYISLANQTSANVNTSQDDAQQQKLFRNVLAHDSSATAFPALLQQQNNGLLSSNRNHNSAVCPAIIRQTSADVDTSEQYQKFDFQPAWMKTKEYWDDDFERRYEESKKDPRRKPLKVILVPHSHNDPGWLKTFEHYFESDTKNILNQLVNKMRQYKQMTFIWSEISFLQAWWDQVHPTKQKAFRKYVESGRLEITTGGWVMTDEANVHLFAMWDQLVEGHQWVKRHLNVTPVTGWSIDPFGHGSTFPYILANSGVKGAIVQRLHYAWKQWLAAKQYGDFLWLTGWEKPENIVDEDRKKRESNVVLDLGNGLDDVKRIKRNADDNLEEGRSRDMLQDGLVKNIDGSAKSYSTSEQNDESHQRNDGLEKRSVVKKAEENKEKKLIPAKKRRRMNKYRRQRQQDGEDQDELMQEETVQYAYVSENGKLRSDTEVSYEVRIRRSAEIDDTVKSRTKRSTKPKNSILTHNMPFDIYSIKHSCGPHPYTCLNFDFRKIKGEYTEYSIKAQFIDASNIQSKAELLLEQYSRAASLFPHNVALVPIGDDFRYNHEIEFDQQYTNYKLLVDYINRNSETYGVDISFGTPRDYFEEINRRTTAFPTLTGDFFVYSDIFTEGRPAYWSGYFTTRPYLKILGRKLEHHLRNAEILFTVASNHARQNNRHDELRLLEKRYEVLIKARRNLALFQHHDAITGTSKFSVMRDYGLKLFQSLQNTIKIQEHAIEILVADSTGDNLRDFILHDLERESYNKLERKVPVLISKNHRQIVLFNSLPQQRSEIVQIRVNTTKIVVLDPRNKEIRIQINPVWNISDEGKWNISDREYEVMFLAKLPPLTLSTYTLVTKNYNDPKKFSVIYCRDCKSTKVPFEIRPMQQGDVQIENANLKLLFDGQSGFLKTITKKSILRPVQCALKFAAYHSAQFHSGAYLFKPDPNTLDPEKDVLSGYTDDLKILITSGPIASELTVTYGVFLTHTVRIYNLKNDSLSQAVYIENLIDFEEPPKNRETELFMRFQTDIENGDPPVFYTDSNGFQYQRRVKVGDIGIEGNYFPITAMTFIQDDKLRLSVLTDHAQGAASFEPGQLEVMLDRRTLYDDSRGMGEGLVDNRPTLFRHWLTLETVGQTKGDTKHEYSRQRRSVPESPALAEMDIETKPLSQQNGNGNGNEQTGSRQPQPQEYQLPSLFAAQLADALNYPVNVYSVEEANGSSVSSESEKPSGKPVTVSQTKSRIALISQPLPCDMRLVNLRTMTDVTYPQFPASSALMMMHRQGYTCSVGQDVPHHCSTPQVHPDTNFHELKVTSVTQVSLTGLEDVERLSSGLGQIYVEPMDLQTVRIDFQD